MTAAMWLLLALLSARADTAPELSYPHPNSTIGVSVGTPWLIGGRGEAWLAEALSGELGAGTLGEVDDAVGFDWALRWRPDFACFGCGGQVLVTFGLGLGGLVVPGLQLTGRAGVGPGWLGTDGSSVEVQPWAFGTAGFAF